MAANTGVSVLNNGVVWEDMSAIENSTLVIAGGTPPAKVRLFDNSRLLILRQSDEATDYQVYGPSDLDEPIGNYAGKELRVTLDGGFVRAFQVLGWANKNLGPTWKGTVEIVRVRDELQAFTTRSGAIIFAFKAPGNQVLQLESSANLKNWNPHGSAFLGDGNTKVEVIRMSEGDNRFFRLRKFARSAEE